MKLNLFADIFNRIDSVTQTFVTDMSGKVITEIMPVISAGLTLSFIFFGLMVAFDKITAPLHELVIRSLRIAIIVSIASAGGLYQSEIASAIRTVPDTFATALVPGDAKNAASLLDGAADAGIQKAGQLWDKISLLEPGSSLSLSVMAVACLFATAVVTGIGAAYILVAKFALALLAGLGPMFILALVFDATKRFFEAWVGQVITYALTVVLISAVMGLICTMFASYMNSADFDDKLHYMSALCGCLILAVVSLVLFLQLPAMAAGLAHGVAVSVGREGNALKNGTQKTGEAVVNTGKALIKKFRGSAGNQ